MIERDKDNTRETSIIPKTASTTAKGNTIYRVQAVYTEYDRGYCSRERLHYTTIYI